MPNITEMKRIIRETNDKLEREKEQQKEEEAKRGGKNVCTD